MMKLFSLAIIFVSILGAQSISCSLSGSVQDSTGAALAGADVTVASEQTGFLRTTRTNSEGFFSFPDLTPSTFKLAISAPGFKKYEQSKIEIGSTEQRTLGIVKLTVGDVKESVTVTAEGAPVQLGSSDRAVGITGEELNEIALRGRDFMDAVGLLPGVVDLTDGRDAPSTASMQDIYIAGGRGNSKNMMVDGITNLDTGSNNTVHMMPTMDSIGEMKVLVSNYAAEYGRNSGGTVSIITRGGGKDFHGNLAWFFKNEALNANDWLNNRNGVARPPYRYNIFDGSIGGPVFIPGKFNRDRSKLFFFFSEEIQRQLVDYGTKTVRVPTALERAGDFSKSDNVNGKMISVFDPTVGRVAFPGNIVPASRFNKVGQAILNMFPMPNFVDPSPSRLYQWNYISSTQGSYPRHTEMGRIDYSPRSNLQLYVRLSNSMDEQHPSVTGIFVVPYANFPLTSVDYKTPAKSGTVHALQTLSPSLFNEFTFGVSQNKITFEPDCMSCVSRSATGINLPSWGYTGDLIPNMSFSGVPNYANPSLHAGIPYSNANTIFSFLDNVSKIAGTHSLKFGVYIERTRKDQNSNALTRGNISFDQDANNPLDGNYAYATALMGVYDSYDEANTRPLGMYRFTNLEWYAQDTWRARPGLTFDFGLRFYRDQPQHDVRNQLASFSWQFWDPKTAPVLLWPALDNGKKVALDRVTGVIYNQGLIGTFAPNEGNPADGMALEGKNGTPTTMYTVPALSVGPRVGFSWDPFGHGKTALRGGFGIVYDRIAGNPTQGLITNPPTVLDPTVYYGTFSQLAAAGGSAFLAPSNSTSLITHGKVPTTYNFSLNVQRELSRSMIVDIAYVGSLTRHALWERNINPIPLHSQHLDEHPENTDPTTKAAYAATFLHILPDFGNINLYEFASTANYHSLQASFNRRLSRGLQVSGNYTFSKVLGAVSGDSAAVSPFFDPRHYNYGPLTYDRTHVANIRYMYLLPKPGRRLGIRALGAVTDNWQLSGTTRFQSGAAFTPGYSLITSANVTGSPSQAARVYVVNPNADPLTRFGPPSKDHFGNVGPGVLRGPGYMNFDMSLYRVIRIRERKTLQVRVESYNTLNHTEYSAISQSAKFDNTGSQVDPLFLQPTNARNARRMQLALRFMW